MGGTHSDVTTIERNAAPQNRCLRCTLVWMATCMDFLTKIDVSDLIWHLPDPIWQQLLERKVYFRLEV